MLFIFQVFSGFLLNSVANLFSTLINIPSTLLTDFVNLILQQVFNVQIPGTTGTGS